MNTKNKTNLGKVLMLYFSLFTITFSQLHADGGRFSRSGDIVTDSATGLQWQDNNDAKTVIKKWTNAIDYCEHLGLDGGGWRLPNINELKSIVDTSRVNPAIVNAFENVGSGSDGYWSSTTREYNTVYAWIVHFFGGNVSNDYKFHPYYVRCVRAGQ